MIRSAFRYSALLAALALVVACKKDQRGGVPLHTVDISVNVNNPAYADLAVPGGWVYMTGGSLGLIVYRSSPTDFMAYDRHCPYQPENQCRLIVDESEIMARDTACCHSAYVITDGSVVEGPAALNLQRYNTSFNGTTLRIYN